MMTEPSRSSSQPFAAEAAPRRPAARPEPLPTFCFSVQAAAEPGVMPRVLELFAKRNLVPSKWHSSVAGPAGEELHIDIQVAGMAPELGDYIARCLRQILHVTCVLTTTKAVEP
jgi:hypothetical protein